jgi:hypothetical protein
MDKNNLPEKKKSGGIGILIIIAIVGLVVGGMIASQPDQREQLCAFAQSEVKKDALDPESVKFPPCEQANIKETGENKFHFFSTVTSKNAFGVNIKRNFGCDINVFNGVYYGSCDVY